MEGQLLYLTYLPREAVWNLRSVPISQKYLDFGEPCSPSRHKLTPPEWNVLDSLVTELSKLCGKHGAMEGWYVTFLAVLSCLGSKFIFCAR